MVGEPMNRSHRLVDIAEDGQIIISETFHAALREDNTLTEEGIEFEPTNPVELKGFATPQTVYCAQILRPSLE